MKRKSKNSKYKSRPKIPVLTNTVIKKLCTFSFKLNVPPLPGTSMLGIGSEKIGQI